MSTAWQTDRRISRVLQSIFDCLPLSAPTSCRHRHKHFHCIDTDLYHGLFFCHCAFVAFLRPPCFSMSVFSFRIKYQVTRGRFTGGKWKHAKNTNVCFETLWPSQLAKSIFVFWQNRIWTFGGFIDDKDVDRCDRRSQSLIDWGSNYSVST